MDLHETCRKLQGRQLCRLGRGARDCQLWPTHKDTWPVIAGGHSRHNILKTSKPPGSGGPRLEQVRKRYGRSCVPIWGTIDSNSLSMSQHLSRSGTSSLNCQFVSHGARGNVPTQCYTQLKSESNVSGSLGRQWTRRRDGRPPCGSSWHLSRPGWPRRDGKTSAARAGKALGQNNSHCNSLRARSIVYLTPANTYIYIWYPPHMPTLFPLRCHGNFEASESSEHCTNVLGPKEQKRCTVPKKSFSAKTSKNAVLSQKNKKPKLGDLQALEEPKASKLWFFLDFLGQYSIFCTFCLKQIGFFGTVQHFRGLGLQKCCTVPRKPIFLSQNKQKCRTVPKKQKKPKLGDLQALEEPKVSKLLFFFVFFGQYSIFALFALKSLIFLGQYSIFKAWDCKNAVLSQKNNHFKTKQAKMPYCPKKTKKTKVGSTALSRLGTAKTLYCPKKTNLFKPKQEKMPYCPKKTKKPKLGDLQALEEPKVSKLLFFCFFWDSTAFLHFLP